MFHTEHLTGLHSQDERDGLRGNGFGSRELGRDGELSFGEGGQFQKRHSRPTEDDEHIACYLNNKYCVAHTQ